MRCFKASGSTCILFIEDMRLSSPCRTNKLERVVYYGVVCLRAINLRDLLRLEIDEIRRRIRFCLSANRLRINGGINNLTVADSINVLWKFVGRESVTANERTKLAFKSMVRCCLFRFILYISNLALRCVLRINRGVSTMDTKISSRHVYNCVRASFGVTELVRQNAKDARVLVRRYTFTICERDRGSRTISTTLFFYNVVDWIFYQI